MIITKPKSTIIIAAIIIAIATIIVMVDVVMVNATRTYQHHNSNSNSNDKTNTTSSQPLRAILLSALESTLEEKQENALIIVQGFHDIDVIPCTGHSQCGVTNGAGYCDFSINECACAHGFYGNLCLDSPTIDSFTWAPTMTGPIISWSPPSTTIPIMAGQRLYLVSSYTGTHLASVNVKLHTIDDLTNPSSPTTIVTTLAMMKPIDTVANWPPLATTPWFDVIIPPNIKPSNNAYITMNFEGWVDPVNNPQVELNPGRFTINNYQWRTSPWETCQAVPCGPSTQIRNVDCVLYDYTTTPPTQTIVADSFCNDQLQSEVKPTTSQPCQVLPDCPRYGWIPGPWSDCSSACFVENPEEIEPGHTFNTRYRSALCFNLDTMTIVDPYDPIIMAKPDPRERYCDIDPTSIPQQWDFGCNTDLIGCGTYGWVPDTWSPCSTTCGVGTQTRTIHCSAKTEYFHDRQIITHPALINLRCGAPTYTFPTTQSCSDYTGCPAPYYP